MFSMQAVVKISKCHIQIFPSINIASVKLFHAHYSQIADSSIWLVYRYKEYFSFFNRNTEFLPANEHTAFKNNYSSKEYMHYITHIFKHSSHVSNDWTQCYSHVDIWDMNNPPKNRPHTF